MRTLLFLTLLLAVAAPAPVAAQIRLTVNSEDDTDDGLCDAGHCSLREAMDSANALAGTDTIAFDIPGAGTFRDILPGSALPAITDPVVIDGTTQPEFSGEPVIRIDGSAKGSGGDGLVVGGAGGSTIRGLVIHSFANGITLNSGGNRVERNIIGTTPRAVDCEGNTGSGVVVAGAGNTVGGGSAAASNTIVCSGSDGILISGNDNTVSGNLIGIANPEDVGSPDAADFSNARDGVRVVAATGTLIGGAGLGQGNTIAHNGAAGVWISGSASASNAVTGNLITENVSEGVALPDAGNGNRIVGNRIFANGALGIDIGADGITPNDLNDGDSGPNRSQNFPVIRSVVVSGSNTFVNGTLNSTPDADFDLEFFDNESCDPSNNGEGALPVTSQSVTTASNGDTSFTAIAQNIELGHYVTATARSVDGSTSEFSACAQAATFTMTIQPDSVTVNRGASARYSIELEPVGGPFTAEIGLRCVEKPSLTSCTFEPDTVIPGAETVTSLLTIETNVTGLPSVAPFDRAGVPSAGLAFALPLLALLALIALRSEGRRRKLALPLAVAVIVAAAAFQAGCGDDGTTGPTGGTPLGRHEFVVRAGSDQITVLETGILRVTQ